MVGETLVKAIRESDVPIRWSGDEVLLVLPGLGLDDARRVAERVRAALQAGTGHRAAVSAGVAELVASETFTTLVTEPASGYAWPSSTGTTGWPKERAEG